MRKKRNIKDLKDGIWEYSLFTIKKVIIYGLQKRSFTEDSLGGTIVKHQNYIIVDDRSHLN